MIPQRRQKDGKQKTPGLFDYVRGAAGDALSDERWQRAYG